MPLDEAQLAQFDRYLDLLVRWNAKIKLTSITEPTLVVERHFLDSLAVVGALRGESLVDVGAGAGFPGVVVAIVRPALRITLVESIQKKAAFLEALKRELGLPGITVRAERMEALVARGATFHSAVSRATFAPEEWLERGAALVAPGGTLIGMVVPEVGRDLAQWAPGWAERFKSGTLGEAYAPGRALVVLSGRRPA